MRITIGQVFTVDGNKLAIDISELGTFTCLKENEIFSYVELDRKQLKKLKKIIERELS